jgi:hypothetical protein
MTPSPGYKRDIRISTTEDPLVNVTWVGSQHESGLYGVGELLELTLHFSDDVVLDTVGGVPYLALNITSLSNTSIDERDYARLPGRLAWCVNGPGRYDVLSFQYMVQEDDFALALDYVRHRWNRSEGPRLQLNGARLTDLIGRNVSLALPEPGQPGSLSGLKAIGIDSTPPVIMTVTTKHGSGTFGAGEVLTVLVNFSRPVVVDGSPKLPINVSGDPSRVGYGDYRFGNGTYTLAFDYVVREGDHVPYLEVREDLAIVLPSFKVEYFVNITRCVDAVGRVHVFNHSTAPWPPAMALYNCSSRNVNATETIWDKVMFASSHPRQAADLSLGFLWERIRDSKAITLDTTPPNVDPAVGVWTSSPNGNYSAGMGLPSSGIHQRVPTYRTVCGR